MFRLAILFTWAVAVSAAAEAGSVPSAKLVRSTGLIEATHSVSVQVPRIAGEGSNLTLVKLIENGVYVKAGDVLAEFDNTTELKAERDALAKFDDVSHQVEQKQAEHRSTWEKRQSDLTQAQADLEKARLEIRKGPTLSAIEQEKNKVKLDDAQAHVESLQRSNHSHDLAEEAEIHVLELQRDRQNLAVERARHNSQQLELRAPINGMVALQNTYRNNSLGHAQEGDQLWGGSALMRLFDPTDMEVEVSVGEPDGAILTPGAKAIIHVDAYPQLHFTAHLLSASPVATAQMGSKVKTFVANFAIDQHDAHLLPDLSAAADITVPSAQTGTLAGAPR